VLPSAGTVPDVHAEKLVYEAGRLGVLVGGEPRKIDHECSAREVLSNKGRVDLMSPRVVLGGGNLKKNINLHRKPVLHHPAAVYLDL